MAGQMANGSLRRRACNQSGPAGSFLTRNRSLPTTTAGRQISKLVGEADRESGRPRKGPSQPRPAYRHLEEVESPKRWPIQSTTALTSSR